MIPTIMIMTVIFSTVSLLHFNSSIEILVYKFKHWRSRFPLLKYLDFSHNLIQAIPEITDYGDTKTDPSVGIIDLRNNNISLITKDMINSFSKHKCKQFYLFHFFPNHKFHLFRKFPHLRTYTLSFEY
jgi:hypothetical protein